MKYFLFITIFSLAACNKFNFVNWPRQEQQENLTYVPTTVTLVNQNKKCFTSNAGDWACKYKVGNDLEFTIWGVGEPDAAIVIDKTQGEDAEYDIRFSPSLKCVTITAGTETFRKVGNSSTESIEFLNKGQYAFVSPANGLPYEDYPSCEQITKNIYSQK